MKKRTAFWATEIALVGIYVLTALVASEQLSAVGVTIIIMLVGNAATYIGGNVADAWQRSKYFRSELDGR